MTRAQGFLADSLKEISGIEFDKAGNLWAINDGGNSAEIHQIDSLGNIHRSIMRIKG